MLIYQPFVLIPRECPLCGRKLVPSDGHIWRDDELTATERSADHDAESHRGALRRRLKGET